MNKKEIKKSEFIQAGINIALDVGLNRLYITSVTKALDCDHTLLYHYFDSIEDYKNQMLQHALDIKELKIIRMMIAANHPLIKQVDLSLQKLAIVG